MMERILYTVLITFYISKKYYNVPNTSASQLIFLTASITMIVVCGLPVGRAVVNKDNTTGAVLFDKDNL